MVLSTKNIYKSPITKTVTAAVIVAFFPFSFVSGITKRTSIPRKGKIASFIAPIYSPISAILKNGNIFSSFPFFWTGKKYKQKH